MKAIALTPRGLVELKKITPNPKKDNVLVDVLAVGLCGSDIKKIMEPDAYSVQYPIVLGHEVCGKDKNGKNVAILPFLRYKTSGQNKKSTSFAYLESIGKTVPGGFQEKIEIPEANLFPLAQHLSTIDATLADPLAVVLHGLSKIKQTVGSKIGIVGDGTIALLSAQILSKNSLTHLFGKNSRSLKLSEIYGAKPVKTNDMGKYRSQFDIIVEAVGTPEALENSFDLAKPAGTVLVFGVYPTNQISLGMRTPFYKELSIIGCNSYGYSEGVNEFEKALTMLSKREVDAKQMITHVIPFIDFLKIKDIHSFKQKENVIKMVMIW